MKWILLLSVLVGCGTTSEDSEDSAAAAKSAKITSANITLNSGVEVIITTTWNVDADVLREGNLRVAATYIEGTSAPTECDTSGTTQVSTGSNDDRGELNFELPSADKTYSLLICQFDADSGEYTPTTFSRGPLE